LKDFIQKYSEKRGFQTLGGIPAVNSSNTESLPSPATSSPSQSSEITKHHRHEDTVASTGLLRPYQKSDGAIPILSAFSARTTSNPDQLQPPGIPITSFNPLLTPAMMAAQIGLLSAPNTLLSVMQAATAQNSLMHLNRCNDRDGQIVPAMLHQLSALHSNQEVRAKLGNESTPNKKEMNQSQLKLSEVGPT
uniref:Dachshund 1 n=1 Tax=Brugia pahangi TaxID=6280 RepID=A0A158PSB7_BRUPA